MIRPPLPSEVLSRYRTDKATGVAAGGHSYGLDLYDRLLPPRRWCSAVLEIGIAGGESLRAWREFFPEAQVIGIDCDRNRLVFEKRIASMCIDCSQPELMHQFAAEYQDYFGVVIEDGSHRLEDQLLAVRTLKRCLRPNGVLVIEDISSADYRPHFEAEGCVVEEWETDKRSDNRVAYYIKEGQ